jgi:hypothetical protein
LEKNQFLEIVDQCIASDDIKYLVIAVDGVGEAEELIINPRENFQSKKEYYDKTYDDNMVHKYSPNIKISYVAGWKNISYEEAE